MNKKQNNDKFVVLFVDFLQTQHLHDEYLMYFDEDYGSEQTVESFLFNSSPYNYLKAAFNWANTQKGYDFWNNINLLWLNELK